MPREKAHEELMSCMGAVATKKETKGEGGSQAKS